MTVEKACGYIREALEEMGEKVGYDQKLRCWVAPYRGRLSFAAVALLLRTLDSLDPMGTTYKEEG